MDGKCHSSAQMPWAPQRQILAVASDECSGIRMRLLLQTRCARARFEIANEVITCKHGAALRCQCGGHARTDNGSVYGVTGRTVDIPEIENSRSEYPRQVKGTRFYERGCQHKHLTIDR